MLGTRSVRISGLRWNLVLLRHIFWNDHVRYEGGIGEGEGEALGKGEVVREDTRGSLDRRCTRTRTHTHTHTHTHKHVVWGLIGE